MDPILVLIVLTALTAYAVGVNASLLLMRWAEHFSPPLSLAIGVLTGIALTLAFFGLSSRVIV